MPPAVGVVVGVVRRAHVEALQPVHLVLVRRVGVAVDVGDVVPRDHRPERLLLLIGPPPRLLPEPVEPVVGHHDHRAPRVPHPLRQVSLQKRQRVPRIPGQRVRLGLRRLVAGEEVHVHQVQPVPVPGVVAVHVRRDRGQPDPVRVPLRHRVRRGRAVLRVVEAPVELVVVPRLGRIEVVVAVSLVDGEAQLPLDPGQPVVRVERPELIAVQRLQPAVLPVLGQVPGDQHAPRIRHRLSRERRVVGPDRPREPVHRQDLEGVLVVRAAAVLGIPHGEERHVGRHPGRRLGPDGRVRIRGSGAAHEQHTERDAEEQRVAHDGIFAHSGRPR